MFKNSNLKQTGHAPSTTIPNESNRLLLFRISVVWCLTAAAVICGYGSYYQVHHYETELQRTGFDLIAVHFRREVTNNLKAKVLTLQAQSSVLSMSCPFTESWPNCTIPMNSYANISDPLIENSNMRTLSFAPIVTADQVDGFEIFAYNFYSSEGYPDLGISSFGKGIFALNKTTGLRYHDKYGYQNGQNKMLVPLLQVGNLAKNDNVAMFNLYSEANRASAIDHIVYSFKASPRKLCTSVTDVVHLIQDSTFRPAVLVMHPISPRTNLSALTGFVQSVFSWDTVIMHAIPHYVSSLDIVLSGGANTYTFRFEYGNVYLSGEGDLHSNKYSSEGQSYKVEAFSGGVAYTLITYPTDAFVNEYYTNNPWYAMAIAVGVILLTSGVFHLYDKSTTYSARETELRKKIETKRLFVRFISHEIRTPLNTVHVGLQLLVSEMTEFLQSEPDISANTVAHLNDWIKLIRDVDASSDSAILVLDDLLNYDKISTGKLTASFELVCLWDVVRDTVKPFTVQARSSGVDLIVDFEFDSAEVPQERRAVLQRLAVVGDKAKLGQVFRNLLSNALKFSRQNDVVEIRVYWEEEGLMSSDLPEIGHLSLSAGSKPKKESAVVPAPTIAFASPSTPQQQLCRAGSLVVIVTDCGAGISQEDQPNLFQEGAQLQAHREQSEQGSGLGLWISKGIVDLHAGRLTAFSAGVGKGAEFRCELPCVLLGSEKRTKDVFVDEPRSSKKTLHLAASYDKSSTTPSVATRRQGSTAPVTRTYSGTTAAASNSSGAGNFSGCNSPLLTSVNGTADAIRRVMVVDDSSTSRMVMVRLLRNAGYECTEAVDGLDCIEKIQGHAASGVPVDLVLMDFEMPRMNGPEATRKIRESGYVIPIVGVTGNVLPADKCFFMAHGANTVLHKPLSIDQLQLELARLNRRSASPVLSQHTNCVEDCFKNYFSGENLV